MREPSAGCAFPLALPAAGWRPQAERPQRLALSHQLPTSERTELVGVAHEAQRLAVAVGLRHAKVAVDVLLRQGRSGAAKG